MAQIRPMENAYEYGNGDTCPMCEQPIPRELSEAVKKRIESRSRAQAADIEARIANERATAEAKAAAALEALRRQAAVDLAAARDDALRVVRDQMSAKLAELEAGRRAAEERIAALLAEQQAREMAKLAHLREQLEREKIAAVQVAETKSFEEKQRLQGKMADLQRQLENKTAQDLGYGPEVDLFEVLKAEFPEDRISRVEKGAPGPDVIHDIYHNGRACGRIVYDSKNSTAWRHDYVSKLRSDQAQTKADHSVLCTRTFPSGVKELHSMDGVLIVSPARVAVLAGMLRRHVVQTATLRLSNEARSEKTAALYRFIMSEQCRHLLTSIALNSEDMINLDRKEEKAHAAVWKKRAELIRSVQRAHGDLTFEIERIIGVAANRPEAVDEPDLETG